MARITLQTIADRVGVSRMTVSNAFSRPDQLSVDLRGKILAAADQLGYSGPDPAARALARGSTGAVGVLLTDSLEHAFTEEINARLLASIAAELGPTGMALTLLGSSWRDDLLPARDVPMDGALIYSCDSASTSVGWLKKRKMPIVFIDQTPVKGYSSINIDDRGGARVATQHLIDLGHRRIAIVTTSTTIPSGVVVTGSAFSTHPVAKNRLLGWLDALTSAAITPQIVNAASTTVESGFAACGPLLDTDATVRPTAILCFCDTIAVGVVHYAEQAGIRVPADLSIIGFDDTALAEHTRPPLTTIRQDVAAKGRAGGIAIISAITANRNGQPSKARHLVLPTSLVVRGSTGPAVTLS